MNRLQKLLMTAGAAGACLTLLAGPVAADEAPQDEPAAEADEGAETDAEEGGEAEADAPEADEAEGDAAESDRIPIAETPRDQVGLIMLAALVLGGGAAAANARRQFKGERPQATGEFRWR